MEPFEILCEVIYDKKRVMFTGMTTRCMQWRSAQTPMLRRHLKLKKVKS